MTIDIVQANEEGQIYAPRNSVAGALLANNMNVNALRTNATLRKDEWELLDKRVIEIARERLNAVSDLFSAGLTFNVPNALGTTIVQHQTRSEMIAAQVSMDGVTQAPSDRVTFSLVSTPLPIIHHDFQIGIRELAASRNGGIPLDTTQAEEASRQVSETIEGLLCNGLTSGDTLGFGTDNARIFGYTNRTSRNTVTLTGNWDESAQDGEDIVADVIAMIQANHNDRMFGPYNLYIPTNYWVELQKDFKTNSDKTILQRISEISGINSIKPLDKLTDDNVLLVQMTRDVVDMAVGMQTTVISWEGQGGMVLYFKVMAIMVPRIKLDHDGRSGVVHAS